MSATLHAFRPRPPQQSQAEIRADAEACYASGQIDRSTFLNHMAAGGVGFQLATIRAQELDMRKRAQP